MRGFALFWLIFFAGFALLTASAARHDVSDAEARLLWIVRDVERVEPAAIGDTARLILRNFRAMLDRAGAADLPLAAPLDVWTMAAGDSIFAARMGGLLILCLAAAVAARILRRIDARAVMLAPAVLLVAAGISLISAGSPADDLLRAYRASRPPAVPVITLFRADSPLGYHHARYDLRRGIGVDLGWRDFTPEEAAHAAANLGNGEVWLLGDGKSPAAERIAAEAVAATGRRAVWCDRAGEVTAYRYAFVSVEDESGLCELDN